MTIDLTRRGILAASAASLISTAALRATAAPAASSGGALLDKVLQAHGGLDAWKSVKWLDVKLTAKGALFQLKHQPAGLQDVTLRVAPHSPRVEIWPFPKPGSRGGYTPQRIWIEDETGKIVMLLHRGMSVIAHDPHVRGVPRAAPLGVDAHASHEIVDDPHRALDVRRRVPFRMGRLVDTGERCKNEFRVFLLDTRGDFEMVDALKKCGSTPAPRLTIYPNTDHWSWVPAYNDPALWMWLLEQRKPLPPKSSDKRRN